MAAAWRMKSNREGLHKFLSGGSPQQWWQQWTNWNPLWSRRSAITSQILDAKYRADSKIMGNIELISAETKPLQNLVWTNVLSMKLSQSSWWKPFWVHSNQHLVTSCEFMQPLVRLCSRLIAIIDDCHLPCIIFMQLMQMWCRWLNCDNVWNTSGKREKIERISRPGIDLSIEDPGEKWDLITK